MYIDKYGLIHYDSLFLDKNIRQNGKTFYYATICHLHKIPLILFNNASKKLIKDKYWYLNLETYSFSQITEKRCIIDIDSNIFINKSIYNYLDDEEIKEIILTDLCNGLDYEEIHIMEKITAEMVIG